MSNFWMAYKNNLDLWSLEKENLVAAQENYRIAIDRYKLGELSGIELREAQNSLLEAMCIRDRDKASLLGVSTRNIAQTLQYALSGQRMGYFYMNGKQYQILGEINRQQRNTPVDLKSIYVRSNNGEMIQLDNLVKVTENVAPPQLYRYNRFVSATVSSGLNKGYTIGDGLDEMDRIASEAVSYTHLHNVFRSCRWVYGNPASLIRAPVISSSWPWLVA